jgi:hypothetical protein
MLKCQRPFPFFSPADTPGPCFFFPPVISLSGEWGSSTPTKCCSQEESTPLLPIASSICATVDYGNERKTERRYNVTNTERIRSERRRKNRKNRAWKKKKKVKPFPHAILAHPHCY